MLMVPASLQCVVEDVNDYWSFDFLFFVRPHRLHRSEARSPNSAGLSGSGPELSGLRMSKLFGDFRHFLAPGDVVRGGPDAVVKFREPFVKPLGDLH